MFADILIDTLTDLAKLLPLLFVTYLLMEYFEDRFAGKSTGLIVRNRWGIPLAALIGAIPQCGFSASAAELYCGGVLSYATLITVFFSTSDEMVPVLIAHHAPMAQLLAIVPYTQLMRHRINLLDLAKRAGIYDELVGMVFGKGGAWDLSLDAS